MGAHPKQKSVRPDKEKTGLDDYLEEHGTEAFKKLPRRDVAAANVREGEEMLIQRRYTLAEALQTFVYLGELDEITTLDNPRIGCSAGHFERLTAASVEKTDTPNGPRIKTVAELWLSHPDRKTAAVRTFAPGEAPLCKDPDGRTAVNTWRPVTHAPQPDWKRRARDAVDHLRYLVPDAEDCEQVLLWLAHMVQCPGEPSPWHVVMYTDDTQGVGRNALAAIVGRVVQPYAALHTDITELAGTPHGPNFNGALAGKLFACVDELKANVFATGGRQQMQRLKATLTADTRSINPKYGKQFKEFNRMRVLILSNHVDALPLDDEDRRFLVIRNPDKPKPASYYAELYEKIKDDAFIASVWQYLRSLDVSKLTRGRAPMTAAKLALIEATEPEHVTAIRGWVAQLDKDLVTSAQISATAPAPGSWQPWQVRQAMKTIGALKYTKRVKQQHVWIVRNHGRWLNAPEDAVARELAPKRAVSDKSDKSVGFINKARRGHGK